MNPTPALSADQAARLIVVFHEALIERFERAGKTRDEAIAIINANKPLFLAEFQRALNAINAETEKQNATVH
jgi:hypothetical protein